MKICIFKVPQYLEFIIYSVIQISPLDAVLWRTPTPEYSGVFSGVEKVLFFTPEKETGAESLKAPESVSGVLRVF